METRGLVITELALLGDVLARRDPGLAPILDRIGSRPLDAAERQRLRRAIVDELCELPNSSDRRALELEELLIHLNEA